MNNLYLFLGLCIVAFVMFVLYKLTIGKKKRFAKPGEVQQRVEYDERYPKRGKILKKEYNLEDSDNPPAQE